MPTVDWRDFDEFGVPSPCPHGWRPLMTERWIQVALENKGRGKDTGVVGGAVMGEVLACPSAPHIGEIHVALLDRLPRRSPLGSPSKAWNVRSDTRHAVVGGVAACARRRSAMAAGCDMRRTNRYDAMGVLDHLATR